VALPDTIVALGTPVGVSAVAVVRLSGARAHEVAYAVCPDLSPSVETRTATLAKAVDPESGEVVDRVVVTLFKGPASYTGEDMAELSSHGGWLSPSLVVEACLKAGARQAEEGEFTRRAYLNGKMDLLQVESVVDLIEGRSRALHERAVHQLERGLSGRISALREGIIHLEALLVHHLDFPEEDDPPVSTEEVSARAHELEEAMDVLLATAPEGELLREGALAVLAGRPNSGKSSLFNALVGRERAIVTDLPGTTRDALESVVSVGGFPFRLVDTAGLRETSEKIEQMGVEVARRYLAEADVVLFCAEASRDLGEDETRFLQDLDSVPSVLIRTKTDLLDGDEKPKGVCVSVETGEGLEALRSTLPPLVYQGLVRQSATVPVLTRERHVRALEAARAEVRLFQAALAQGHPAEVAATHLRPAETALEELLGTIPREAILDRLFRDFCIGK
jgi:tRNA modification GTPase